jgi:hypothetical protein
MAVEDKAEIVTLIREVGYQVELFDNCHRRLDIVDSSPLEQTHRVYETGRSGLDPAEIGSRVVRIESGTRGLGAERRDEKGCLDNSLPRQTPTRRPRHANLIAQASGFSQRRVWLPSSRPSLLASKPPVKVVA